MMKRRRQTPYQMKKSAENWASQVHRNQHLETEVNEATPHRLIQMLFNALLSHLENAQRGLERGDATSKATWLNKAQKCIGEARASLRFDLYPELAANLFDLYDYCERLLVQAKLKPLNPSSNLEAIALVKETAALLKPIQEAWFETAAEAEAFRTDLIEKQRAAASDLDLESDAPTTDEPVQP